MLNLLFAISLIGFLLVAGFILRFWFKRRERGSAREPITPNHGVLAEEDREPEANVPPAELSKTQPVADHSADVEPGRIEKQSEPVISSESDLPLPVDASIEVQSQEQKPVEPIVIRDYDRQSGAIAEHPLDAEPIHESSLNEPDTVEQRDSSPTESIERISETIVTGEHDLASAAVEHSIDTESIHKSSSNQAESSGEPAEFAAVPLETKVSTTSVLADPEAESAEHEPTVADTYQASEIHTNGLHEHDDIDQSSVVVPGSAAEGIGDNSMLSDERLDDESDSTQVLIQDQSQITPAAEAIGTGSVTPTLEQSTRKKKRQPRYRPPIRTGQVDRSTRREQFPATQPAQSRSLSMSVHARPLTHRRNQWRVSLIAPRSREFPEEITIKSAGGSETWYARQDEWYEGIIPPNLGDLLESAGRWESDDGGFNWVLSAREIYVLAPDSTISGFVNTSTLALAEDHVVLCTHRQKEAVKRALLDAGAEVSSIVSGNGIPDGWLLFDDIPAISGYQTRSRSRNL